MLVFNCVYIEFRRRKRKGRHQDVIPADKCSLGFGPQQDTGAPERKGICKIRDPYRLYKPRTSSGRVNYVKVPAILSIDCIFIVREPREHGRKGNWWICSTQTSQQGKLPNVVPSPDWPEKHSMA
jgi:hypothetical protein